MLYCASDDPDLRDWLNYQAEHGCNFLRSLADAAKLANIAQYAILRPALVMFRAQTPEPGSMTADAAPSPAEENEHVESGEEEGIRRHRFSNIESIRGDGYVGFESISTLQNTDCDHVPDAPGVYLVVRPEITTPEFLEESIGGHFKGKNPTVPVGVLREKWVRNAIALYIGKAGSTGGRTLKMRLIEYMRFGRGVPVAHWGGRFIWQLPNSGDFLVCWKATLPGTDPRDEEEELIRDFEVEHGEIPFANHQH
jgi:hypothetical protein